MTNDDDEYVRLFTLEEAIDLLPHVREQMEVLRENQFELDRLRPEIERLEQVAGSNGHASAGQLEALKRKAFMCETTIGARRANLRGAGCELKGIDPGLVDFPSERDGRVVYLCWQYDEPTIAFWHELDAGFAGRRRL